MAERTSSEPAPAVSPQVFQILLSLLDGAMHGYALIQDIRKRTDGEIVLTASTLYAAVKRLLGSGWIEEVEPETPPVGHDARRRYYRITARGKAAAQAEAAALGPVIQRVRDLTGATLVVVEHDMPLLMGMADLVAVLDAGRLIAYGPPAAVRTDPAVIEAYLGQESA